MRFLPLFVGVLFSLCSVMANAKPFVADLAIRSIEITSSFNGTDILLFGARNDAGDIVIVVRGPLHTYTVRKKEHVAGIWMNRSHETFHDINGFYAIASSLPLEKINNASLLNALQISTSEWELLSGVTSKDDPFQQAFLRYKLNDDLYPLALGEVQFMGDTLFRSIIHFPEKIPRGIYTAEVYLFSDGMLMGMQSTRIEVVKSGMDAWLYDFAYKYSAFYALIAIFLSLLAGAVASAVFNRI